MLCLLLLLPTTRLLLLSRLLVLMMMLPLMLLRLELVLLLLLLLLPLMLQPPTPALFLLLLLLLDLQDSFLETHFPTHPQHGHLQETRVFQSPCQWADGHGFVWPSVRSSGGVATPWSRSSWSKIT